jgi:hypothetical protein
VQIAIDGVRAHSHRTRMQRMLRGPGRDFAVREVSPAFRLAEPFPTVLTVQCSAPPAQQFHIAAAYQVVHWQLPRLGFPFSSGILVCRCDPFASVLRSIEEATAALTYGGVRFAMSLDAKATVRRGLLGRRLSAPRTAGASEDCASHRKPMSAASKDDAQ